MKILVKTLVTVVLMTAMALSAAACKPTPTTASSAATSSSVPEAPKKVQWMIVEYSDYKYTNDLKIYQQLEKAGNIEIEIIPVPIDSYVEKFNITTASNELPDIMHVFGTDNVKTANEYGPKGMFACITDYLNIAPNLSKWLTEYKDSVPGISANDNKIYILPQVITSTKANIGIAVRTDILKKNGYDPAKIKTTDDLYDAFVVLKNANGGKPILGARNGIGNLNYLARVFGTAINNSVYYDSTAKKYINPIATQNAKDAVAYMAKLFANGILHPDFISMSDKDWSAKKNSELLVFVDNMQNMNGFLNTMRQTDPNFTGGYEGIMPPSYNGKTYAWGHSLKLTNDWSPAISAKSEAIEGIIKAFDWMYDDANYQWIHYGDEGVTSHMGKDGLPKLDLADLGSEYEAGQKQMTDVYGIGFNMNLFLVGKDDYYYEWYYLEKDTTPFEPASQLYTEKVYTFLDPTGNLKFTDAEQEVMKNVKTPVDTYIAENVTAFVLGTRPMSDWDAFVTAVDGMNVKQVADAYNAALGRLS